MPNEQGMPKKKMLLAWITIETDEQFRSFLAWKYGTFRKGILSYEVENALRSYLQDMDETHTRTQITVADLKSSVKSPIPNVFIVRNQIRDYLRETFDYEQFTQVARIHIEQAIAALRGTDRRTIKKWMILLLRYNLVKYKKNSKRVMCFASTEI